MRRLGVGAGWQRTLAIRGTLGLAQAWAPLPEVWMRRHFIFVLPALALALALAGCRWTGASSQAAPTHVAAAAEGPAAQPSASPSPSPPPVLRPGMRGQAVRLLQRRLAALKYYPGRVNGRFGSNTLE